MKKTLITLLALSGLAMGETLTLDTQYTKDEVKGSLYDARIDESLNDGIYTGDLLGGLQAGTGAFSITIDVKNLYSVKDISENATLTLKSLDYISHGYGWFTGGGRSVTISNGTESVTAQIPAVDENTVNKHIIHIDFASGITFAPDSTLTMSVAPKAGSTDKLSIWYAKPQTDVTISGASIDNQTNMYAALRLTVEAVPEPTTATLSLLALAGLAARRRRR